MLAGMLATMCDRGPDSAGFAVYGDRSAGRDQAHPARAVADCDFERAACRSSR